MREPNCIFYNNGCGLGLGRDGKPTLYECRWCLHRLAADPAKPAILGPKSIDRAAWERDRARKISLAMKSWPLPARMLARLAKPGDRGIGDIVARFTSATRLDRLVHRMAGLLKRQCGCVDRREEWNTRWPLPGAVQRKV